MTTHITSSSQFDYKNTQNWDNTTFQPQADIKASIELFDGNTIQTAGFKVLRPECRVEYHACVSTQAGCRFGCKMCISGRNGFTRDLTVEEIIDQVDYIAEKFGVKMLDHVVFMGIGEPLDNYSNFLSAIRSLNEKGYERKLSFATVGNPKRIYTFANEDVPVRMLWLSIHAPNDTRRLEILPVAKSFNIRSVIDAGLYFAQKTGSEVRVNYLLYRGFNDSFEDARELTQLLEGTEAYINLQLTEPNDVTFKGYAYGDRSDIERFRTYLIGHGLKNKIVRFLAAGKPLQAGCGEFAYIPGT